jgi:hypothetical protein
MSVAPDPATAADAPIAEAQKNVAEEADKHTPETPAPAGDAAKTDPTDSKDGLAELREQVTTLANTVDTLVKAVTEKASESPDEAATRLPFLLRGKSEK